MDELTKQVDTKTKSFRLVVIISSIIASIFAITMFSFLLYFVIAKQTYIGLLIGVSVVCLVICSVFLIQTIKSFQIRKLGGAQLKKVEKTAIVFGIFLIIIFPVSGYALFAFGGEVNIQKNYFWNDGPWLTYGENPTTDMSISWLTRFTKKTSIQFGTSPENMETITSPSVKTHLHHILLSGFEPNTIYYYSLGIKTSIFPANAIFSFKTAPDVNDAFKVIIVGDMQPGAGKLLHAGDLVAKGIIAENPDFVIQLGDLAIDGGFPIFWHYTAQNFPQYAATTPFQVLVGNHDYGGAGLGANNFRNAFPHPYESDVGLYYSFDYASAHFIMIDNFDAGGYTMTDVQKIWVEQDIIDAQTRGQDWIFISFHHTMFTTGTSSQNIALQSWLAPLADNYNVDGVFFGHDHHYEHWNYTYGNMGLLYNETDIPSGNNTQYWCTGGGGAKLEVGYGVLKHDVWKDTRTFYNTTAGTYQEIDFYRSPWNASRVVNSPEHQIYAASASDGLYYHAPDLESYSTDNELYGYMYGEQTRHYMIIEINADGTLCTISAHYPNGDLMTGPYGNYPQIWTFSK